MQVLRRRQSIATETLVQTGLVLAVAGILALGYFLSQGFHDGVHHAISMLSRGDVDALRDYILSFGVWAPFVSLLLMIVQAVVAPIPGFIVIFANGLAFGVFWGGLLSLVGQTLAAIVCFALARQLGRKPVEAIVGRLGLASTDSWVARRGPYGVLLARLIPGMAFDAISYGAGLTSMSFWRFAMATAVGTAPQAFIYAYLGQNAARYAWWLLGITLAVAFGLAGLALVRRRRGSDRGRGNAQLVPIASSFEEKLRDESCKLPSS
ncbi:MAG TPA: TVP38/TMEM64 family protein [Thermomicrobiales bacterium]|nr:TVP38/TMEM64 family protein [Thermomicrobiales bacterium]